MKNKTNKKLLTANLVGTRHFICLKPDPPPLDSQDDELNVDWGVLKPDCTLSLAVFAATPSSNFSRRLVSVDKVPSNLFK